MLLFRYRTKVLVGPWRHSREEALADAVKVRQVRRESGLFKWAVPGEIEERRERESA